MSHVDALSQIEDSRFRQICEAAVTGMERWAAPGVAVGVLHGDDEHVAGLGVTSVENPLPVTADTLFQIGSITKTFLATLAMRLVEMGRLDLDVPLRAYLPGLRLLNEDAAARVTMRHLLTHTGGWVGDYFDDLGPGEDALARMLERVAGLPQLTPLGAVWSYNNSGFYLAGRVIEVVTGQTFEAAMKELVLDPLGMTNSFFFAEDVITRRFVVGHQVIDRQPQVARPWAIGRAAHPAGGLVSTVNDLFRYARFHMGDGAAPGGTRLLSRETLARMQTPVLPASGIDLIGLSWFVTPVDGHTVVGHGGGTNGQVTHFSIVPQARLAVIVLTNSSDGGNVCFDVLKAALKVYLGATWPEAIPLDLPEEQLVPCVGRYESAMTVCDLSLRDGGLILQVTPKGGFPRPDSPPSPAPPPVRLALYAEDRAVIPDDPLKDARAEFLRDADGRIAWLRIGGRIHARSRAQ